MTEEEKKSVNTRRLENVLRDISQVSEDNSKRLPSTGNPADYLKVEDYRDLRKGQRVVFSTQIMPKSADMAIHRWFQGSTHQDKRKWVEPAAADFTNIMGFSPEQLVQAREELEKEISSK